jgi:twitching motility protein PilT
MESGTRKKIGELLVAAGLVTPEAVEQALRGQQQAGGVIGEHLVRQGAVEEKALLKMLSRQTGLQHVNLHKIALSPEAQRKVRLDTVKELRVLPVATDGHTLALGMVNPMDVGAERRAEEESGLSVRPLLLSGRQFDALVELTEERGWGQAPLRLEGEPAASIPPPPRRDLPWLLAAVVAAGGQDLYLTAGSIPSMRLDGELNRMPLEPMNGEEIEGLVGAILTPRQQEIFRQKMELDFAWSCPGVGRFRCNLYRQRGAPAFTARHVKERIPTQEELGLPSWMRGYALRKQGLVLVVGPTSHGKSTTMASLVDIINRERHANIITIEDPIEYVHHHRSSNVNQREVGTDTFSFVEGLRHAYRQSPDVLVIGEIRDEESASIALSAAETGHLVLATMHAQSATAAVDRLLEFLPAEEQRAARARLADSLLLVFSQRLLPRQGAPGRVLAYEHVGGSLLVRNAIREGRVHAIRNAMQANAAEVASIDACLAGLLAAGKIRREEAVKYCDSPAFLSDLLRIRGLAPLADHG